MNFVIAQWLGVATTVIALVGVQFKSINHILVSQILTNLLSALVFGLLGGFSGAWICVVAIVQTVTMFCFNRHSGRQTHRGILAAAFCLVYVLGTAWFYKGWGDLVSGTCAVLFALAVVQENSEKFRGLFLVNGLLWMVYDLTTGAYTNLMTHGLSVGSTVVAMVRYRRGAGT
ncbi:MAG: YgjV family protein [Eubacteriales bacterium]|nr:YgjV family protein [Eubacteriales bacterium]